MYSSTVINRVEAVVSMLLNIVSRHVAFVSAKRMEYNVGNTVRTAA